MKPLNDWLSTTIRRARLLIEDSDRKNFSGIKLEQLIRRVNNLATTGAIRAPAPDVMERYQTEDSVVLEFGWVDKKSGWHLYFSVRRPIGEKPYAQLDFSGAGEHTYTSDKPTDADITKSLHDYFESWRRR